jgi:hypothetical protein
VIPTERALGKVHFLVFWQGEKLTGEIEDILVVEAERYIR